MISAFLVNEQYRKETGQIIQHYIFSSNTTLNSQQEFPYSV